MAIKANEMLVGGAIVFKDGKGKKQFLLFKNEDGNFEVLKTIARKGESSVRSVIRYTTEQGSMNTRVLEEVGRASGTTTVNGRTVIQKYLYYLMYYKAGGEMIGLENVVWFDYAQSLRKLKLKREQDALKAANKYIKEWEKNKKKSNRFAQDQGQDENNDPS